MKKKSVLRAIKTIVIFVIIFSAVVAITLGCCFLLIKKARLYEDEITWGILGLKTALIIGLVLPTFFSGGFLIAFIFTKIALNENEVMGHVIYPFPKKLMLEEISENKNLFLRADDEFLIINNGNRKYPLLLGAFFTILTGIAIIPGLIKGELSREGGFVSPIFVVAFLAFVYGIFYPKKHFIFDRMKGIITMPGPFFFPSCTIPFEKLRIGNFRDSLTFIHPYTRIGIIAYGEYCASDWSFYVLYMDHNRPLPQGTAFDPYREKDFKRRQKEGFPKPLYPNEVWVCDAYMGYIYGTEEFKKKMAGFRVNFMGAYDIVSWHLIDTKTKINNDNDIVLIGIWSDYYVFRLFAPENQEYFVFDDNDKPNNCYLVHGKTKKLIYVPPKSENEM